MLSLPHPLAVFFFHLCGGYQRPPRNLSVDEMRSFHRCASAVGAVGISSLRMRATGLGSTTVHLPTMRFASTKEGATVEDPFAQLMAKLKGVDTSATRAKPQQRASKKQVASLQLPMPPVQGDKDASPTGGFKRDSASPVESLPSPARPPSPPPPTKQQTDRLGIALSEEETNSRFILRKGFSATSGGVVDAPSTSTATASSAANAPSNGTQKGNSGKHATPMALQQSTTNEESATLLCAAAANVPLTTSEMIQEGAPQFFVVEPGTESIQRPVLHTSGCVAMSDMIGRVLSAPEAFEDPSGNGTYAAFKVEYTVPFSATPVQVSMEVRAYGPVLSQYAVEELVEGDIVHVAGHLLPTENGMAVVALPWGGNISVVLTPK